jgi:hypothetical protein
MYGQMLLSVDWRPLGLSPALLGAILVLAAIALLAHHRSRVRQDGGGALGRNRGLMRALVGTRRLRLTRQAPYVQVETTDEQWKIMGTDAELYWALALFTAGIGAFLGAAVS